jgi:hypothetical protein
MKVSLQVKHAHEEIQCCHIAVCWLYTAIQNENDMFGMTLSRLRTGDPLVYGAVCDFVTRRQEVNLLLLARLTLLTNSPDYKGDCSHGVWVGVSMDVDTPGSISADSENAVDGVDDDGELDEDEVDTLVRQLADYVSDLAV